MLNDKDTERVQTIFLTLMQHAYSDFLGDEDLGSMPLLTDEETLRKSHFLKTVMNSTTWNLEVSSLISGLLPPDSNIEFCRAVGAWSEKFIMSLVLPILGAEFFVETEFFKTASNKEFNEHLLNFIFLFYERRRMGFDDSIIFVYRMWVSVELVKQIMEERDKVITEDYDEIDAWRRLEALQ